ncbi:MAG: efflux RND transporter periplasmic adaptor subunit [Bacteroidales bacterium]|nr:efflux RND transporter periplasmic adaptor subunit [Bacteroidales bacterium]
MKKKVFKYSLFALAGILLIGIFAVLAYRSKPKEVQYEELTVGYGDIRRSCIVTGKIVPRNEVNVKPQINGIIAELYKEAGQTVKENEIIAKLKVIPDMTSLSSAQSRVRLAEINFEREQALYDQNLVSAEEYEQVRQALHQANEEYSAAEDALEVIRDGVSSSNATGSSTLVRSTISGLILDIPVKVGNSVIQANTMNDGTTVATVADMNDLIFDGNIDETEVGRLKEGMSVIITIGALQDFSCEATLEYISPKAVENNGANQFEIKAAIMPQSEQKIRSGYSSNAEIVLEEKTHVLSISESAITFEGDRNFVYIKKDDNWKKVHVRTGLSDGINIEITQGLEEGDIIRGNAIIEE